LIIRRLLENFEMLDLRALRGALVQEGAMVTAGFVLYGI